MVKFNLKWLLFNFHDLLLKQRKGEKDLRIRNWALESFFFFFWLSLWTCRYFLWMLNFWIKVILINFVPDMFVNVNQPDEAVFKVWETWASCLCHCKWHQHGYFIEFSDFDSSLSSSLCLGYKCGCNPVALKQWCGAQSHGRGSIDIQGEMEWNWSMIHQEEKRWTSLTFTSINSAWVHLYF